MLNPNVESIVDEAAKKGIHFLLEGNKLILKIPRTEKPDPELLELISTHKEGIKLFLQNNEQLVDAGKAKRSMAAFNRSEFTHLPLSFAQERLWFVDRLQGSTQYHMPWIFRLTGELNTEVLEAAFRTIIQRHEILRTVIREEEGISYQEVQTAAGWKPVYSTKETLAAENSDPTTCIQTWINSPFDLSNDTMLRVILIRLAANTWQMGMMLHHIAFDGWSIPILVEELSALYNSGLQQSQAILKELPIQYADYAVWQRSWLSGTTLETNLAYWKEQLKNLTPLALLTELPRPATQSIRGATVQKTIDRDCYQQLVLLSQQEGITLYMLLLAAYKILLYRYTGQEDICVGTPVAGRQQQDTEALIGFFVNMLAIRSAVNGMTDSKTFLQQVRQTMLKAYEHQDLPFEKIVEALETERDMTRTPVFQVTFALNHASAAAELSLKGLDLQKETAGTVLSKFEIHLDVTEHPEGLSLELTWCSDLYAPASMERLLGHYTNLLQDMVQDLHTPVSKLAMLTSSEELQLLREFNDTQLLYTGGHSIVTRWEEWVAQTPDAVALVFNKERLTYQELDQRSSQLANYLKGLGLQQEAPVVICLDRSLNMIVSILAILKAGGAYLPIDPEYPASRVGYMLNDSASTIVITTTHYRELISSCTQTAQILSLDELGEALHKYPGKVANMEINANHLAYIIYTSGSTGQPKGVMIEHGGVVNLVNSQVAPLRLRSGIHVFQFASCSFDASCYEIFNTLLTGGRLILSSKETILDPEQLGALLLKEEVELITLPPTYQSVIGDAGKTIQTVVSAGEVLNTRMAMSIMEKGIRLVNAYGPTENTVCATLATSPLQANGSVTIGKPIANVQAYILDQHLIPVPIGVMGELCLGGAQLARGYLNQPELTKEKFVQHPFNKQPGARIYRTGDMARWLPDGNIEFLGRMDEQVKIRGYRIELGEIENVLHAGPGVRQAVVIAKDDQEGIKRLIAYIVANSDFNKETLTDWLQAKLPHYMVPGILVALETMPLNTSGKVDRKRLPDIGMGQSEALYVPPRNETEYLLAVIWQELLGQERVGMHDNFFQLGGHSLLAMRMAAAIRKQTGMEMAIKTLFANPTIAALGAALAQQEAPGSMQEIASFDRTQPLPLSFAQERLWFIDRLQGSVQYHMPWVFRLTGILDTAALESSFRSIVDRHEVLRTVIREEGGIGFQQINQAAPWQMEYLEAPATPHQATTLPAFIEGFINRPFNLQKDPMLRVILIRLPDNEHLLVAVVHHIAFDGWSISILVKELKELYNSFLEKRIARLDPISVQYADYAIWQRQYLSGSRLESKLVYWKNQLRDLEPLALPTDHPRPAEQSIRGGMVQKKLSTALQDGLVALSQREGVTLFMTLLSAFKILLYRYSGQTDICVGSPTAGRRQQEAEGLIGFFVNMLALRTGFTATTPYRELLQQVSRTTLDAYEHQELPFEKVVEQLGTTRDLSRTPVFQVVFALQNIPDPGELKLNKLALKREVLGEPMSRYDLNLDATVTTQGIQLDLTYCADLFSSGTMERLLDHYQNLLAAILTDINAPVGQLPLLSAIETQQLLVEFNDTATPYPTHKTFVTLFQEQALQTPGAVALEFEGAIITYRELDQRSNQLAHYLCSKGVQPESLVPVCLERSASLLVVLLGIVKAGAAYVPIDPMYPPARIQFMVADTGAGIVITSSAQHPLFTANTTIKHIIEIDGDWKKISRCKKAAINEAGPHQLAYVIYTSGSTGNPKGVMIRHSGLLNFLLSMSRQLGTTATHSILSVTTYTFDISCLELFMPLLSGGKIFLASRQTTTDGWQLRSLLATTRPTYMQATPATWQMLVEAGWQNEEQIIILTGGEAFPVKLKETLTGFSEQPVWNLYGPTETTIWSTIASLQREEKITIGRPIANTQVLILDPALQLVPIGVLGELCIAGDGLAIGYLHQPDLTRQRFIPHPFEAGKRLYRTGDLARWLPDGNIEYAGRIDHQVKIRGYRIELGEIETVLLEAPGIQQGVVVAREDKQGLKRLIAYVVADSFQKETTHVYLKNRLPEYMIPSILVELPALPLTTNGKIDRKQLPEPDTTSLFAGTYQGPRNGLEEQLVLIWQSLLGIDRVGIYDNFFELGGHSLLAMRIVSAIQQQTGKEVSIRDLFNNPEIAALAQQITLHAGKDMLPAIGTLPRPEFLPLSFAQERLWFIDRLQGTVQYHLPWIFRVRGALDMPALESAFRTIVQRHEPLRTVIREQQGIGYQATIPADHWLLPVVNASTIAANGKTLPEFMEAQAQESFDLAQDFMLRAYLVQLSGQEYLLNTIVHHIAFDGWSIGIMIDELSTLYKNYTAQAEVELQALPVQYADYSVWQRHCLTGALLQSKLTYWKEQLSNLEPLELLTDHPRPAAQSIRGAAADRTISKSIRDGLVTLSKQEGVTLFTTLLAAFKVLMHRYTGQTDICIGSPVAGRQQLETAGMIGFFVNTLALRSDLDGHPSFAVLLQRIKQTTLSAYEHQELPFEKVVEAIGVKRDMSRNPLFQIMFALQQHVPGSGTLDLGAIQLTGEGYGLITALLDMDWTVTDTKEGLALHIVYCSDLYKAETIERMMEHYEHLLQSILLDIHQPIGQLNLVSPAEQQLLQHFNDTDKAYPHNKTIVALFREQVVRTPTAIAAKCNGQQLTYEELHQRANQLARFLISKGIGKGATVAVAANRDLDFLVSMLGIFIACGVYVPLDTNNPLQRNGAILTACEATILICSEEHTQPQAQRFSQQILAVSNVQEVIFLKDINPLQETALVAVDLSVSDLAYIIYTSGSTGTPKGAMIEHAGMVNHLYAKINDVKINATTVLAQNAAHTFDISIWQFLAALVTGGQVVIYPNELILQPEIFLHSLREDGVTVLEVVPTYLDLLLDTCAREQMTLPGIHYLLVTGETIRPGSIQQWFTLHPNSKVVNAYGPTEASDDITHCILQQNSDLQRIPIGKPVQNMRIYIVDAGMQLCPVGVVGEICVAGIGVGRGYLKAAALTDKVFMPDPFQQEGAARLYRTGDLGYWRSDGQVEFLGRKDEQVKIRGYRIELGEIEAALLRAPYVQQAVVVATTDAWGNKQLTGYLVGDTTIQAAAVLGFVRTILPDYMVPAQLVTLAQIPLTPNGKVDRKQLTDTAPAITPIHTYEAPRTTTETDLSAVWQELLHLERIGINDNFFELGGDSIITIQVVSRMKRQGYQLHPRQLFLHQTIASLALAMDQAGAASNEQLAEQGLLSGNSGLLPLQQWFFDSEPAVPSHYNQHLLLKIDKRIGETQLEAAVKILLAHHDSLRFIYHEDVNGWQQQYGAYAGELMVEDLRAIAPGSLSAAIEETGNKYQRSLDIEKGSLVRIVLLQTPGSENQNRLLIVIHHLAMDGVSWRILLEDLDRLLSGLMDNELVSLGIKTNSVREWHHTLMQYSAQAGLLAQKGYWEKVIAGHHSLPKDKEAPSSCTMQEIRNHSVKLDASYTRQLLQEAPAAYHTNINDLLLAALAKTCCTWANQPSIVIGLEGHGRESLANGMDLSRTVGWFTSLFPVLLQLPEETDNSQLIKSIKEQLRKLPQNGIGYGVLKWMVREEALAGSDPWDIVFNYLGQADNMMDKSNWLSMANEAAGEPVAPVMKQLTGLELNCVVADGTLNMSWNYSSVHYFEATIIDLATAFKQHLEWLIVHCLEQNKIGPCNTPSDYGLTHEVDYIELDRFLDSPQQGEPRKKYLEGLYRLSSLQEGILFQGLYDATAGAYLLQKSCELTGVQPALFHQSWNYLLQQHTILRTAFYPDLFRIPVQAVYANVSIPMTIIDYRGMTSAEQEEQIKQFEEADRRWGFDFGEAPLMRVSLLRLEDEKYKMLWTAHHLVLDGWSVPVLIDTFLTTYRQLAAGRALATPPVDRYEDYIRFIEQRNQEQEKDYWKKYLRNVEEASLLPFISTATERNRGVSAFRETSLLLDKQGTLQLDAYVKQQHTTVNTLMQAVWAYLLYRYTGNRSVTFGVTVSGRPEELAGMESRVGMYINALPLHSCVKDEQPVSEWLQEIQKDQLLSREYQYAALTDLQQWAELPGDLFDSMMTFQNYPVNQVITPEQGQLQVTNMQMQEQTSNYPFSIRVIAGESIQVQLIYKEELLSEEYVNRIRGHFERVLLGIINQPDMHVGALRWLTATEETQLLVDFNDTAVPYPAHKTILSLFEEWVNKTPAATALVFEEEILTYNMLDQRSNQLAHYLRSQGVQEETLVAICLDRSVEMIVSIFGILKAGGAYLPIDPEYPADRISYLLEDSGCKMVITTTHHNTIVEEHENELMILYLDVAENTLQAQPVEKTTCTVQENNLAYVIYTSGSTGLPKGVMIEHRTMVNLVYNQVGPLGLHAGMPVFQFASCSFDASCHEIFTTLLQGGQLILAPRAILLDPVALCEVLAKHSVELITLPPSYQSAIKEANLPLRTLISAGEMLNRKLAVEIQQQGIKLINAYGPTENTVSAILSESPLHESGCVTIGKPLANVQAFILDPQLQPVSVGVMGELYLGGAQLARGYLNRPELTAEKFIRHPFSEESGARIYKTGDMARWLPDGHIEYLGRKDDQVKIRGYRVELGEIETVLQQAPGVQQAVVLAREDKQGIKNLVAYIVATGIFNKEDVLLYLKSKLPEYMIPGSWVTLESMPLNTSGKIDRKQLPEPDGALTTNGYNAPRNETEQQLVTIWQELLELEQVGIHADFFELGGHSLMAIQLIAAIRKELGKEVAIKEVFDHPTIAALSVQINRQENKELLPVISRRESAMRIPLSFAQERLWFIDRLQGSVQYHMPSVFRLTGKLDKRALENALRAIVNRHEVLRTVIREEDGVGYQHINPPDQWQLQYLPGKEITDNNNTLQDYIKEFLQQPFDLAADSMLRAVLIEVAAEEYTLVTVLHHIAFDGWSVPILVQELIALYSSELDQRKPVLKELPVQYADYAIWQRDYLSGDRLQNKLNYWTAQLNGVEPLALPVDLVRPAELSVRGATIRKTISKERYHQLVALSQQEGVTLFMTLLSVFKVLLYRYTGQLDICVGSPIAGRAQQEIQALLGFFVNTLALRTSMDEERPFRELLQQVKQTTLDAYEHQELPFEKIVEALGVQRDMSRTPVFQVLFTMMNSSDAFGIELSGVRMVAEPPVSLTAQFEISFEVIETLQGLQLLINYCTDHFYEETMERMLQHYEHLLTAILVSMDTPIGSIPMLSDREQEQLRTGFNNTAIDFPCNKTICGLFEEQALRTPEAIAVVFDGEQLTYRTLNERTNQLAHYLRSKGVQEETMVPICVHRSLEMIIGIMGILKAGGAYVPVDPEYPLSRINYILEDTGASLVVTTEEHSHLFPVQQAARQLVQLDRDQKQIAKKSKTACDGVQAGQLAYVIYTSGSTGKPKGVMNEHGGVVNRLLWTQQYFGLTEQDSVLQKTTYCFDVSVWELFWPLLNGARLVFARPGGQGDSAYLKTIIEQEHITTIHFVPSMLGAFLEAINPGDCSSLHYLLCSGEALKPQQLILCKEKLPGTGLYNLYGPTEAAVDVSCWQAPSSISTFTTVPIGKPIANTQLYIVDKKFNLVPPGVSGELLIGGVQVSRGYLNQPALTTEKFIADPFSVVPGKRLYRTGDLARWLSDGNIEYLGRLDDQVKIRGFRIELGEIEAVLLTAPGIQQAVVIATEDDLGHKRLVGYLVTEATYRKEAMVSHLKNRLPDYMVPAIWIELETMPLTTSGKANRKALPAPDAAARVTHEYAAASTEIEKQLSLIWQQLLGITQVGVHDNFFELGGDSIIIIQVVSRMKRLGYSLHPRDLFQRQTIHGLAAMISNQSNRNANEAGEQGLLDGPAGLLPIQQSWFEKAAGTVSHYNQSILLKIDKRIDPAILHKAIQLLTEQHDALRFRYQPSTSGWQQAYGSNTATLSVEDLGSCPSASLPVTMEEYSDRYQRSLDIEKGDLLRMVLLLTPATEKHNRLLMIIHHLAVDGVSWRILLEDLELLLTGLMKGISVSLGSKGPSYREWHQHLAKYAAQQHLQEQLSYWEKAIAAYHPLPASASPDHYCTMQYIRTHSLKLDAVRTRELLQEVPAAYHTNINDTLLSALAKTIGAWSNNYQVTIGMEGHGRETHGTAPDTSRTVGWFTHLYPVLLEVPDSLPVGHLVKSVKEHLRKVPDNGMGYGVLKYLRRVEELQGRDPWDLVFNYLGQADNIMRESQWLESAPESTGSPVSEEFLRPNNLELTGIIAGAELILTWSYSSIHFDTSTIESLAQQYLDNLELVISHCMEQPVGANATPADYGLTTELHYTELDQFLEEPVNGSTRKNTIEALYRLSSLQEGILFQSIYHREGTAYLQQMHAMIRDLQVIPFAHSWDLLLQRHTILRSSFYPDTFKIPVQAINREVRMPIEIVDCQDMGPEEQARFIREFENTDLHKAFDLSTAPLMRVSLLQLSHNHFKMLWTSHHLILDGWSVPVLIHHFLEIYHALAIGNSPEEQPVDRYEAYIRYTERRDKEQAIAYWKKYLHGITNGSMLPFVLPANKQAMGAGGFNQQSLLLNTLTTTQLTAYAQQHRITLNTLIQGVWSYLLYRYTGTKDILFAVTVAGRPEDLPGIESGVGMYINVLPLRTRIDEEQVLVNWLQQIQEEQLLSRDYQYETLSSIQQWAGLPGQLFHSMLSFQNYPVSQLAGQQWQLQVEELELREHASDYPLSIRVMLEKEITIQFIYQPTLIEKTYITKIREHFEEILHRLLEKETIRVGDLDPAMTSALPVYEPSTDQDDLFNFSADTIQHS
jgi:amino acid adenylation domain-containing protein/non-ribosomal peptide synthase protein (TIGR01720 family)